MKALNIFNTNLPYSSIDDINILSLIKQVRKGIDFNTFLRYARKSSLSLIEWADFLHISERTMQRYLKDKKSLAPVQSEKFIEIVLLYKKGAEVFGNEPKFDLWLNTENLALGNIKPKSLFDSTFGINLLIDELTRIEHGVLA
ncbi:MAG: DUF2384 domain-containing protein [Saprospiraceae bacterium]|nr:DUF2384 domain-containing protein [Saprospiraceae bacterium]MBK7371130.1 DUF2384 domain-containing protein [Saprospiraceae bacterium]MBK7609476.1 DUF2384 domain-containing protein [Saprospiraceae bacterium]MBP7801932.1 DUF2384 domain-containing protein [Saprospiraceae bacterium]MBP8095641.1 DUF2384 domain-containing protein [Saprospiraceae bacterium]